MAKFILRGEGCTSLALFSEFGGGGKRTEPRDSIRLYKIDGEMSAIRCAPPPPSSIASLAYWNGPAVGMLNHTLNYG